MIRKASDFHAIETARVVAYVAHLGQVDKAGLPYFEHCEAVSIEAQRNAGQFSPTPDYDAPRCAVLGYLHDVLEDTDVTDPDLRAIGVHPQDVSALGLLCHIPGESRASYIGRIIASGNRRAIYTKLADNADNLGLLRDRHHELPPDKHAQYSTERQQLLGEL